MSEPLTPGKQAAEIAAEAKATGTPAPNGEVILGDDGQPLSKNALKKREKELEKERKKKEREEKEKKAKEEKEKTEVDYAQDNYGQLPLNQSGERTYRQRHRIADMANMNPGEEVLFRATVQNSRAQGAKMLFLLLRQAPPPSDSSSIQAILAVSPEKVSKQMVKWAQQSLNTESMVLVQGKIQQPIEEVKSAGVGTREVAVDKIYLVHKAPSQLAFQLEDASRPESEYERTDTEFVRVTQPVLLDNRVLDLRTTTNQAIFQITDGVTFFFREFLRKQGFMEIHSPKLQGAATESGASVFEVKYFNGKAFLAQSPQLAKQMAIASNMEKVYEIGPVFRAENSNTHRHLTEFTGLDLECAFEEHYHEVMELIDRMLIHIFTGLRNEYSKDIRMVMKQFTGIDDFVWIEGEEEVDVGGEGGKRKKTKTPRFEYRDVVKILREEGWEMEDDEDINTEKEKAFGVIVKKKYNTDYYIIDKFPLALRPFYTMPDAKDPTLSNSYDFFMRGEEILSGAQRVHDPALLVENMKRVGIEKSAMKHYVEAFELGAPPHAGAGLGLERIVMLFLGVGNIRKASLFPRDPNRLAP